MANKTVVVDSKDADPNTKLQDIISWNPSNMPVISIIEKPARIKIKNGTKLVVVDVTIQGSDGRGYFYIAEGSHKGKYVRAEDVA
jgi:hypothetical protein